MPPSPSPAEPQSSGSSRGILVVDDDRAVRTVMTRLLEDAGYRVMAAESSLEALFLWAGYGPSFGLVITDLCATEPSSHALIQQLVHQGASIPMLVVSSPVYAGSIQETLASADVDFLPKPFAPEALLNRVRALLPPSAADPRPAVRRDGTR